MILKNQNLKKSLKMMDNKTMHNNNLKKILKMKNKKKIR